VLEGESMIWSGENKVVISTGENFLIPVGTPHVVAAIGDQPARGLILAAPSAFARLIEATGTQRIRQKHRHGAVRSRFCRNWR